jgi:hypothetical protein
VKAGLVAVLLALTVAVAAAAQVEARPLSGNVLLAIDGKAGFRNYLPTRMLSGFTYTSWTYKSGVLRIDFRNQAGWDVQWRVGVMTAGSCAAGMQQSFQLDGNKIWWARNAKNQFAWRCVFGQDGKPLRLEAASSISPAKLGASGLGVVAASAKRY